MVLGGDELDMREVSWTYTGTSGIFWICAVNGWTWVK